MHNSCLDDSVPLHELVVHVLHLPELLCRTCDSERFLVKFSNLVFTPYLAEVHPRPRAKNARHIPTYTHDTARARPRASLRLSPMAAVEGRGAAPPGAAPRPSTAAEAHSSTAQPAGQPAGSVVGRVEQCASDSECEQALFPTRTHGSCTRRPN